MDGAGRRALTPPAGRAGAPGAGGLRARPGAAAGGGLPEGGVPLHAVRDHQLHRARSVGRGGGGGDWGRVVGGRG